MKKHFNKYIENGVFVLLLNLLVFVGWRLSVYWFEFQYPVCFYLLLLIPLLSVWFVWKSGNIHAEIRISTLGHFKGIKRNWRIFFKSSWFFFRVLALSGLIVILARPQSKSNWQNIDAEGIDIVIAFDVSASMLAKDFRPNRLESAKKVARNFIDQRVDDRIGLVIYEGEAFTQCPLTTDHRVLNQLLSQIRTGWVEGGTAVGLGLATAVNRLRDSEAKSKVIILLTDGVNNAGNIPPLTAAEIAKEYGIRVYTVGVGTRGKALSPVSLSANGQYNFAYADVEIDEVGMSQ
ncbi:MAG: VWA domain-containing protein, partial [Bacteroidota bacterium]